MGLARVRTRLLDLKLTNPLLNFRHTARVVRVVDELPDVLGRRLRHGDELTFAPVPEPATGAPRTRRARAAAAPDATASTTAIVVATVPERSVEDVAREHGIRPEFELPAPPAEGTEAPASRADNRIQTLLFPAELELRLGKVTNDARTTIEETGSNMLHLVFGFLEWYADDADEPLYAPLLLLPVLLRRGEPDTKTATYRFHVAYSGEDVIANLSLGEKMRQDFALELPEPDDDELPEAYFARLAPLLAGRPRWRVRRQVSLAMLSFGKLLMYQDLDPARWPAGHTPAEHPRVRELFEGRAEHAASAGEYQLDAPALRAELPDVILDADSSQHSALVDAVRGRNLVIEGPPGTGKSQTITNLIAAAMARGRSVLFVAEKLAAIEVVRRRLDEAGLGLFCLELHSHKTQKAALIDDVRARLEKRGGFRDPRTLDEQARALDEHRARLSAHAELINRPFGGRGQSAYQVFWAFERARRDLDRVDPGPLDAIEIAGIAAWTETEWAHHREAIEAYAQHLALLQAGATPAAVHPWRGVNAAGRAGQDLAVRGALEDVAVAARAIVAELAGAEGGAPLPANRAALEPLLGAAATLHAASRATLTALLPGLAEPTWRAQLADLAHALEQLHGRAAALAGSLGRAPAELDPQLDALRAACERARSLGLEGADLGQLFPQGARFTWLAHETRSACEFSRATSAALGLALPDTGTWLPLAVDLAAAARSAPLEALYVRNAGLDVEAVEPVLRAMAGEVQALREQHQRLSAEFDLSLATDAAQLANFATVCAGAGFLAAMNTGYRIARSTYTSLARGAPPASNERMADAFRRLASYRARRDAFEHNEAFRRALGSLFLGLESPFAHIEAYRTWRRGLRHAMLRYGAGGQQAEQALVAASDVALRALAALAPDPGAAREQVHQLVAALGALRHLAAPLEQPLPAVAASLDAIALDATTLAQTLTAAAPGFRGTVASLAAQLEAASALRAARAELEASPALAALTSIAPTAGAATDPGPLRATLALVDAVERSALPAPLRAWLTAAPSAARLEALAAQAQRLRALFDQLEAAHTRFATLAGLDAVGWYGDAIPLHERDVPRVLERAERALARRELLPGWMDFLLARRLLAGLGLAPLLQRLEDGSVPPAALRRAADYVAQHSLVRSLVAAHPPLALFDGTRHDAVRAQFRETDARIVALARERIAHRIDQRAVPAGVATGTVGSLTDLGLLDHEVRKQRRHVPIRQLVRRAGGALQALKPCFMMGPRSVAQYLPPGQIAFDLVVMDEASQLRPEDALGAVARGGQLVVVGDSNQLPPTSFFDTLTDDEPDDARTVTDDAESILQAASTVYQPGRRLRWHYRSRHGSLIAFSNRQFYNSDLIVFPSPEDRTEALGVRFEHVADGLYDDGRNEVEARRVAAAALEHLRLHPGESIGVVALNLKQRELIEDEIHRLLKSDDALRKRYAEAHAGPEPFFVKNLENVQGDERDVILISVTYGRSAPGGRVVQRFGPINGRDGWRRLNVLFTRAKRRVVAFASFDPDEIRVDAESARGVAALRDYLVYAKTGRLDDARVAERPPASDFELSVASALRARGYDTQPRVGVAGYFVDLAVRDPRRPERFVLGIECDGAMYNASYSARDRDRLRQGVLEGLGWQIHRVWSVDWFKHGDRELERLVQRLEAVLRAASDLVPVTG